MYTTSVASAGANASGDIANPGASVQSSHCFAEKGGWTARELGVAIDSDQK